MPSSGDCDAWPSRPRPRSPQNGDLFSGPVPSMSAFANPFRAEQLCTCRSRRDSHRALRAGVRAGPDAATGAGGADHPGSGDTATAAAPAAPSTATAVLTVTVNDATGAPLPDVKITVIGPVEREGSTTTMGQARLLGIRAGTYRVRFEREGFYTFEKEVIWRAGTPAPTARPRSRRAPPPPPPPDRRSRKPAAQATRCPTYRRRQAVDDVGARLHRAQLHLEQGAAQGEPDRLQRRRADVAVAGAGPVARRSTRSAELMLYVVGGDGTLSLDGRDVTVAAGSFAVVPARHELRVHQARPQSR